MGNNCSQCSKCHLSIVLGQSPGALNTEIGVVPISTNAPLLRFIFYSTWSRTFKITPSCFTWSWWYILPRSCCPFHEWFIFFLSRACTVPHFLLNHSETLSYWLVTKTEVGDCLEEDTYYLVRHWQRLHQGGVCHLWALRMGIRRSIFSSLSTHMLSSQISESIPFI